MTNDKQKTKFDRLVESRLFDENHSLYTYNHSNKIDSCFYRNDENGLFGLPNILNLHLAHNYIIF